MEKELGKDGKMASKTLEEVAEYIKKIRFKKGFFGLKPTSVWKKLEDLDAEYRSVVYVQEVSYEARIKEKEEKIAELEKRLSELKSPTSEGAENG